MEPTNNITYPIFRMYKNRKSFFKIISENEFEEIQLIGKKYTMHHIVARILPERNFLYDMIHDFENNWDEIGENEYEQVKKLLINNP